MLRRKALRKIFITSLTLFIILTIYLIPNINTGNVLKTNMEVEYVNGLGTNYIYLLDNNRLLIKYKVLITDDNIKDKIKSIIDYLTIDSNKSLPDNVYQTIPKNTKLLDISINNKIVELNFSNELLKVEKELSERMIESIVFSIIDSDDIDGIIIKVDNNILNSYPNTDIKIPNILTKEIGINKRYNFVSRNDINKVVVYYLEDINDTNYYVPVTKYVNDDRDKIKIVIDNLTTSFIYEPNLMSLLNKNVKINKYLEQENVMYIDFNNSIFNDDNKIEEEVIYTISYSIFDNYDVESVIYTVNDKDKRVVKRKNIY